MQVFKAKQNLQHHVSEVHDKSSEVICPERGCQEVLSSARVAVSHIKLKHMGTPKIVCYALQCLSCGEINKVEYCLNLN